MRILKATVTVTLSFLVLDLLWLGVVGSNIYDETLGPLRAKEVVWAAAGLFYAQYVAVIVGFAVLPAVSLAQAAKRGLGIGWLAYATYELTNWAVITDWPAVLVPIDIAWGLVLTTSCAVAGRFVAGPPSDRDASAGFKNVAAPSPDAMTGTANRVSSQALEALIVDLASDDPDRIRKGLELAQRVHASGLDKPLTAILERPEPNLRKLALKALGHQGAWKALSKIHTCVQDPVAEVRAAAVEAFCAIGREKAIDVCSNLLDDGSPRVREATIAGFIQHGGLVGMLRAIEPLNQLLESENPDDRVSAARVLCAIRVQSFHPQVLRLLADENPKVVKAALEAAGAMKTLELFPSVIYRMSLRDYTDDAVRALVAMGDEAVPLLAKVIANPREEASVRAQIPRILSQIGTPLAASVLESNGLDFPVDQADGRAPESGQEF